MQQEVKIDKKYDKIRGEKFFFLKYDSGEDQYGNKIANPSWSSIDPEIGISISDKNFGNPDLYYSLCITDSVYSSKLYNDNLLYVKFHEASYGSIDDCFVLLEEYIYRSKDVEDKYAFSGLLWYFNNIGVCSSVLTSAIRKFDDRFIPHILELLRKICRCLSIRNQQNVQASFRECGGEYTIYMPDFFIEAYELVKNAAKNNGDNFDNDYDNFKDYRNINIFDLIDAVVGYFSPKHHYNLKSYDNLILKFTEWFNSNTKFKNYDSLKSLYSVVSEDIRMFMVKRYFHDIRLGNTKFDITLLCQFIDNKYSDFIRYRYCIETPSERVSITVQLLCDCIRTLYNTKGKMFQTFDGVLDFAITHCDKVHPKVKLNLKKFIPTCEHGAVYNSAFKGFIDYQLIRKINEKLITDDILSKTIKNILNIYGEIHMFKTRPYKIVKHISYEQYCNCVSNLFSKDYNAGLESERIQYIKYEDRWFVSSKHLDIINSFLKKEVQYNPNIDSIYITKEMISVERFKQFILNLPSSYYELEDGEFIVPSYKTSNGNYNLTLLEKFSNIISMRIIPQKDALIGSEFDVFGFWKEEKSHLSNEALINKTSQEFLNAYNAYIAKESEEVTRRTINSLKKELNIKNYNGEYFEIPYERRTLINIINKFYFKESYTKDDDKHVHEFLEVIHFNNNFLYCAPQHSKINNPAVDLPYFWCQGKECFQNHLDNQVLENTRDWKSYTLYHMVEIIGYPMLHKIKAGYESDPVINKFIAVTSKAMQKFKSLRCRSCGHLLFTDKSSGYNRYNYYSCVNPSCPECNKPIYLNFCFHCKKGLIDSRDTKQCPNGWYICPKCLSCCDDNQYERLAQRYIISSRAIPHWIESKLGHGHNDKGIYYCPGCGSLIKKVQDENGIDHLVCTKCGRIFD